MLTSITPTVKELEEELDLVRQLLAETMGCTSICPLNCDVYRRIHAYLYNELPLPKPRRNRHRISGS